VFGSKEVKHLGTKYCCKASSETYLILGLPELRTVSLSSILELTANR
jgi:hypothetical protein